MHLLGFCEAVAGANMPTSRHSEERNEEESLFLFDRNPKRVPRYACLRQAGSELTGLVFFFKTAQIDC